MITAHLPNGHVWLRLTQPHYVDPFDTTFAQANGGRWNPPQSWPTLYLNQDMATVHAQVRYIFEGRGIDPDDLDDSAPIELAAASLPDHQDVADVVSDEGVAALGLPPSYPVAEDGSRVDHDVTQPIGTRIFRAGLRGVWCRSAAGTGAEVAWFPASSAVAHPLWKSAVPFSRWRRAATLSDIEIDTEIETDGDVASVNSADHGGTDHGS